MYLGQLSLDSSFKIENKVLSLLLILGKYRRGKLSGTVHILGTLPVGFWLFKGDTGLTCNFTVNLTLGLSTVLYTVMTI
jgi:hypothetical protein